MRARPHEPVELTEHFKPGIEEICAMLPPALARWILAWAARTGRLGKVYFSMHVRTTTVFGFGRLWLLSRLRLRHQWIPDWIRRPGEMIPSTRMPANFRSPTFSW